MKKSAARFWIVSAICAGTALLWVFLYWNHAQTPQNLEFYSQDLRTRFGHKTPLDPGLVLIGIDRPSYGSELSDEEKRGDPTLQLLARNFPWSRAVWAVVIQRLADAGAKVIALDLVFSGQGEGDDALRQVLDKCRDRVVIGANFRDVKSDRGRNP